MAVVRFVSLFITLGLVTTTVAATELPFSTNDLSILIPLDNQQKPAFSVNAGDPNWRILSLQNFKAVLAAAEAEKAFLTPKLKDPRNWYLIAIRYAPCMLFHGSTCKEQIRFVYQSLNAERGSSGFDDYAIHVVYAYSDLPAPVRSPRLESFRLLKDKFADATLNKTLQVHPVLSGPRGQEYFEAFHQEIIQKHVNNRAPSVITFQGLGPNALSNTESDSDHWVFFTGNVATNGQWALAQLNVGGPFKSEHLQLDEKDEFSLITNIKTTKDQFNLFQDGMKIETARKMSLKILNQRLTNDHTVACASCHQADARVFPVLFDSDDTKGRAQFLKSMLAMLKTNPRVSEKLIDNSVHIGRMGFEVPAVRIFGYLDDRALISQRVVNDSAIAVEQANQLIGVQPNAQCVSDKQRVELLTCLYLKEYNASLEACMKQACP